MPTLCVTNQKGGVGKTTTAVNVAASLAGYCSKKVALIDWDTQGNATRALGYDSGTTGEVALGDLLQAVGEGTTDLPWNKAFLGTEVDGLYLLPGHKQLTNYLPQHRPDLLAALIKQLPSGLEYVVVDCPPGLTLQTTNAIMAADWAVVPCEQSIFSMEGLSDLLHMLEQLATVKQDFDPASFYRILLTKVNASRKRSAEYIAEELAPYRDKLFSRFIRENDALNQAHAAGKPIFLYDSASNGAKDYYQLTHEILAYEEARVQKKQLARAAQG